MKNIFEAMRNLQEMAIDQSNAMRDIRSKVDEILVHLLKCFLYKDNTGNLKHWKREIYGFLNKVPKLKNNKKYPSYKLLKNNTIDMFDDVLLERITPLYINQLISDGYPKVKNYNEQNLYNGVIEYFDWLIKRLSNIGYINSQESYNKIDEIINKYNF